MAKVLVTESYLSDIADSIREKLGTEDTYKPGEMSAAIDEISGGGGGGDIDVEAVTFNANGTYTAPDGKAYSPVTVNVPQDAEMGPLQIDENGIYEASTYGYDGFSRVIVSVAGSIVRPKPDGIFNASDLWAEYTWPSTVTGEQSS